MHIYLGAIGLIENEGESHKIVQNDEFYIAAKIQGNCFTDSVSYLKFEFPTNCY